MLSCFFLDFCFLDMAKSPLAGEIGDFRLLLDVDLDAWIFTVFTARVPGGGGQDTVIIQMDSDMRSVVGFHLTPTNANLTIIYVLQ